MLKCRILKSCFFGLGEVWAQHARRVAKNGRVRLGIPAACGPNCKGRSKNRGPPSLLQDCVFDRADRTAEKDGTLFSRGATKSGCLRLLQVKSTLWDYNTITLRGGWVRATPLTPVTPVRDLDPKKQFVAKAFRLRDPGRGGARGGPLLISKIGLELRSPKTIAKGP